jgi:intracellular septation protein
MIFGYMTLHFHKPKFIQMRDTLYDATCALTLITGILIRVPFLKLAFEEVLPMSMRAWNKLTHLWIGYFILIAASNEVVRRLFPLHIWFDFKGWVVVATSIFGIIALYMSYEEKEKGSL